MSNLKLSGNKLTISYRDTSLINCSQLTRGKLVDFTNLYYVKKCGFVHAIALKWLKRNTHL